MRWLSVRSGVGLGDLDSGIDARGLASAATSGNAPCPGYLLTLAQALRSEPRDQNCATTTQLLALVAP